MSRMIADNAKPKDRGDTHYDPWSGFWIGTDRHDTFHGTSLADWFNGGGGKDVLFGWNGNDRLHGGAGDDHLFGGSGDDVLRGVADGEPELVTHEANQLMGGAGNDTYIVGGFGDRVLEKLDEGIDTVITRVGFELPKNVENLYADYTHIVGDPTLIGNELDNHIVGAPFSYESIFGLDGNDTLDGGGRHGGILDGGNGNDTLIVSFGELIGGAGADTFVAGGRGAMTSPDVPITVLDFNAAEGDRISFGALPASPQALFESGQLRFEAETSRLILDLDPSTTQPGSVDQIFILTGVQSFDPGFVVATDVFI